MKEDLTISEAAELLSVTVPTVREWEKRGLIKTWRTPGNQRRIPMSEVRRLKETSNGRDMETGTRLPGV